jgi:opacity protein-like surface antigen
MCEAGVSLNFNTYVAIVPSYRYTWVDGSSGVTEESLTSHSAQVGLRVSF